MISVKHVIPNMAICNAETCDSNIYTGLTITFENSPPCACRGSTGQKP